jgi:hypothetical protein
MENIVLERKFNPPLDDKSLQQLMAGVADCLGIYRADWQESFLSEDGSLLACCFKAPDSESVRMMSRGDGSQSKVAWSGSVHDTGRPGRANVLVERRFEEPVTLESLQAIEDAAAECLELHRVTFLRTYFSANKKNMLCLYQAPDTESVRIAQQKAGMPVERIWACKHFLPANFSS